MRGKKGHKKKIGLSAAIVFSLTLAGCGSSSKAFEKGKAPDYSVAESWVSLPAASENASDEAENNFDVFFILPTVNLELKEPCNEDLTVKKNRERFIKTFAMEKGIVGEDSDIYAPFYRQASMGCYYGADGKVDESLYTSEAVSEYFDLAYSDVESAWQYYKDNYYDGDPVVYFGYSQGAEMLLRLMAEHSDDELFSSNMIAAYAIGTSVSEDFIAKNPSIKVATEEKDTGVLVSFNAMDARAKMPEGKEYSINPLNWRTDSEKASRNLNLGYVVTDVKGNITEEIASYCGGYIDETSGKMIVTDIDGQDALYSAEGIFKSGDYHLYDLAFFYRNLQNNVKQRTESFFSK